MKTIEVTREQLLEQIKKDEAQRELIKKSHFVKLGDSYFYTERISQCKDILEKGYGIFSQFKNEQVNVQMVED